jgi:hypothetical protein
VSVRGPAERWRREFDGVPLVTYQSEAPGGLLAERLGPLEFWFRLTVSDGALIYRQESLGLRLGAHRIQIPAWLAVEIAAREAPADRLSHHDDGSALPSIERPPSVGRTCVEVRLSGPAGGLIFAYRGSVSWSPAGDQTNGHRTTRHLIRGALT